MSAAMDSANPVYARRRRVRCHPGNHRRAPLTRDVVSTSSSKAAVTWPATTERLSADMLSGICRHSAKTGSLFR